MKVLFVTFSNNADHQNTVYSMFRALESKAEVYTLGLKNPKSRIAPATKRNWYVDGPARPGIELKTFRLDIIFNMVRLIRKHNIQYIYFESLHVWNLFLMILCPQCVRVETVHDVIPHDLSKTVALCTKVCCKIADHIVLRNAKYKSLLAKNCGVPEDKITSFELWRDFPPYDATTHSGICLCFGRIRKYKGLDKLEEIVQKTPEVKYQIVGAPDKESRSIVEALRRYTNVEMIDKEVSDNEMLCYFHGADWVVLPYTSATQSGVIVDAYKFSRPVISFNVGAIAEQVQDGVTGFLVPPGQVQQFAQVITQCVHMSATDVERFAKQAYGYGYNKYAAAAVSDKFLQLLQSLGEKK